MIVQMGPRPGVTKGISDSDSGIFQIFLLWACFEGREGHKIRYNLANFQLKSDKNPLLPCVAKCLQTDIFLSDLITQYRHSYRL